MYTRIITGGIAAPSRRPLKIFAVDPMLGKTFGNRARVAIANEVVRAGPVGQRVAVIDYDGARKCFYDPVDLNNPSLLLQGGLDPSELREARAAASRRHCARSAPLHRPDQRPNRSPLRPRGEGNSYHYHSFEGNPYHSLTLTSKRAAFGLSDKNRRALRSTLALHIAREAQ